MEAIEIEIEMEVMSISEMRGLHAISTWVTTRACIYYR